MLLSRVSFLAAVALAVAACSHDTPPPAAPAPVARHAPAERGHGPVVPPASTPPATVTSTSGGLPTGGVACAQLGCVYHAGADAYFACMSSGAGACFHFGARCAPADACMYDAAAKRYQHCDAVVEGACSKWGLACTPAAGCLFDPADGLHHACATVKDGACSSWGALCAPS